MKNFSGSLSTVIDCSVTRHGLKDVPRWCTRLQGSAAGGPLVLPEVQCVACDCEPQGQPCCCYKADLLPGVSDLAGEGSGAESNFEQILLCMGIGFQLQC